MTGYSVICYDYTSDEKARVQIASATDNLIGKGAQRRFNEFFAMSAGEFCLFEFNFTTREWDRIPMERIPAAVVSTTFGPGRGEKLHQVYLATINGQVHEYVRQELEPEPESE